MDIKKEIVNIFNEINENNRNNNIEDFSIKYQELLKNVFCDDSITLIESRQYISILYRIIFQTRDFVNGKGEYKFAHIMIGELVKFGYTEYGKNYKSITDNLANMALYNLVYFTDNNDSLSNGGSCMPYGSCFPCLPCGSCLPYGSWKDIKYFCNYLRDHVLIATDEEEVSQLPIFKYIIKIVVEQLKADIDIINENKENDMNNIIISSEKRKNPSLLCKWLPREKSIKFGWLAKHIAMEYYPEWINLTTNNIKTYKKSIRKCLTHYRQIVSYANKILQTTQIYQCGQQWESINFEKNVTKQTLKNQKSAFKNENKDNNEDNEDRNKCRDNYNSYIEDKIQEEEQEEQEEQENEEPKMMTWKEINNELSHYRYKWADELITKLWIFKSAYTYTYTDTNEKNVVDSNAVDSNAVDLCESDFACDVDLCEADAYANEVLNKIEYEYEEDESVEDEDEDTLIIVDDEVDADANKVDANKVDANNKPKQGWLGWLGLGWN